MQTINPNLRTEVIEVLIGNAGASEFIIGQLPNLREAKSIKRIESFHVGQVSLSPSGKAVVATAVHQKAFIRLINRDNVEFRSMPLISLSKVTNGSTIENVNTPQIDPEKSKIVVGNTTGLTANEVFLLEITYEK